MWIPFSRAEIPPSNPLHLYPNFIVLQCHASSCFGTEPVSLNGKAGAIMPTSVSREIPNMQTLPAWFLLGCQWDSYRFSQYLCAPRSHISLMQIFQSPKCYTAVDITMHQHPLNVAKPNFVYDVPVFVYAYCNGIVGKTVFSKAPSTPQECFQEPRNFLSFCTKESGTIL